MDKITKDDFYKKYGIVKVKFFRYFKYTFTYEAILSKDRRLICKIGGCDDIYRHEVLADKEETINSLDLNEGIIYENGKEIEGFYDY
jgi:hypothetical protein